MADNDEWFTFPAPERAVITGVGFRYSRPTGKPPTYEIRLPEPPNEPKEPDKTEGQ